MEKRKIIVLSCAIALSILLLFSTKSITKSSVISIDDLDSTEIVNHKPEIQMYYFIKKYSHHYIQNYRRSNFFCYQLKYFHLY